MDNPIIIESDKVFDAVRRGYSELLTATDEDILNYFDSISDNSIIGHVSNIKDILFEKKYVNKLSELGIEISQFPHTNHPNTDIQIFKDGEILEELQPKTTDSLNYIGAQLDDSDISIVATTEIASSATSNMIIDSGISNFLLEQIIFETLFPSTSISLLLEGFEDGLDSLFDFN